MKKKQATRPGVEQMEWRHLENGPAGCVIFSVEYINTTLNPVNMPRWG